MGDGDSGTKSEERLGPSGVPRNRGSGDRSLDRQAGVGSRLTHERRSSGSTRLASGDPSAPEQAHTPKDSDAHRRVVNRLLFVWRPALGKVFVDVELARANGSIRIDQNIDVYFTSDRYIKDVELGPFVGRLIEISSGLIDELMILLNLAGAEDRTWIRTHRNYWVRWRRMASDASITDIEKLWNHFRGLNQLLLEVVESFVPAPAGESTSTSRLTAEQRAQLRQLAMAMNFPEVQRGYLRIMNWVKEQEWLGELKEFIERTETAVEAAYRVAGKELPTPLRRLKLVSKLISMKGTLDKVMLLVNAGNRVEGRADQARFTAFVKAWHRWGWIGLMNFYRDARTRGQPAYTGVTESFFVEELHPSNQIAIALTVARVLQADRQVNFEVVAAEIQETLKITGELAWWAVNKVFLNRIPGWAVVKLVVGHVADFVKAYIA